MCLYALPFIYRMINGISRNKDENIAEELTLVCFNLRLYIFTNRHNNYLREDKDQSNMSMAV